MVNYFVSYICILGDCLDKVPVEMKSDLTPGSNAKGADAPRGKQANQTS